MEFDVSRKAFTRLRDLRFVDLLAEIEIRRLHETALSKNNPEARCVRMMKISQLVPDTVKTTFIALRKQPIILAHYVSLNRRA